MGKTKKAAPAAKPKAKAKAEVKPKARASAPAAETKEPKKNLFPLYEGAQVTEIIEENVNGKWHHAKMSDGTTKHVPIELFDAPEAK